MASIDLSYRLSEPTQRHGKGVHRRVHPAMSNPLIQLLVAVRDEGSIAGAAATLRRSYRHAWGELKRWEANLKVPLVLWEQGKAARLSPFGLRLLHADALAQARLSPHIEAIESEFSRALALVFEPQADLISVCASHDEALVALRDYAANTTRSAVHLDIRFCGSLEALRALNDGRCLVAGFHSALHGEASRASARSYKRSLDPSRHVIIPFSRRTQGLAVARGNPLGIADLTDVIAKRLRYANRDKGTGTRVLLDSLLREVGAKPSQLLGYRQLEPSHRAVVEAVAQGYADAGLVIEAATRGSPVDFVPLAGERYDLVCRRETLADASIKRLRTMLRHQRWLALLGSLTGYESVDATPVAIDRALGWW